MSWTFIPVHGNGGGAFRFERLRAHLPHEVRFHPVTLPGFGGVPRDPSLSSLSAYAARLAEWASSFPRPRVLLGHGIGGSILLEMLQRHRQEADAVILHAPVGAQLDRRLFPLLMKPRFLREAARRMIASPLARPLFRRLFFSRPVPGDYAARFLAEYGRCEAFSQMFDLIHAPWFAGLEPVSIPALLLWGERERILRAGQHSAFLPLLPDARVRIVPGWDHFPMVEQPAQYAQVVAESAAALLEPADLRS